MKYIIYLYYQLVESERVFLKYSFLYGITLFFLIFTIILTDPFKQITTAFLTDNSKQNNEQLLPVSNDDLMPPYGRRGEPTYEELPGHVLSLQSNIDVDLYTKSEPIPSPTDCKADNLIGKIETEEKVVVYTFDADGLETSTNEILSAFSKRDLKTTFFISGSWASRYPQLVDKIASEGHEIFNHSMTHANFKDLTNDGIKLELSSADNTISKLSGNSTKPFFRPPYGAKDARVMSTVCEAGYYTIIWNIDGNDWREKKGITKEEVRANVLVNLKPGGIILMHTGNNLSGALIDELLDETINQGYRPIQLSEAFRNY